VGTGIRLDADPRSVGRARRFCASTLDEWGAAADTVTTCVLLVSELATNAVLHAHSGFTVRMEQGDALRVEVDDDDPRLPQVRDYRVDSASGRGMRMVRALARASGATATSAGKTVWFELDWDAEPGT
jgi:anti-sigma regulatory factor (Ser/Thr protein kinase)